MSNPFDALSDAELRAYISENGQVAPVLATRQQLIAQCTQLGKDVEARLATTMTNASRNGPPHHSSSQTAHGRAVDFGAPMARARPGVPHAMPAPGGPTKRALLIGVNYMGTRAQLNGCINDARCLHYLLTHRLGFREDQCLFMTDDHPDPSRRPTRANIMQGIVWLTTGLQPNQPTSLVFSFSGHGSQSRDYSGQESDGKNETLLPLDHDYAGQIVDDELNQLLVNPLPQGTKLHAIIDACHSGSVMDLPYTATCHAGYLRWESEYAPGMYQAMWKGTAGGFAVQFGASRDHQVAADTTKLSGGVATGAATFSFIAALERRGLNITYGELLVEMYNTLLQAGLGGSGGGSGGGGFGGLDGMLMGMLGGGGGFRGQEPVMSANYAFDLNYKIQF